MKSDRLILAGAFAAFSLFTYTSAFSASMDQLPPEKMLGSIAYLSGGIGKDEARALERAEHKYPLSLEFAQHAKPHDEFLADVNVTIRDLKGNTELQTKSDGPFLLVRMPAGRYTVMAEEGGKTKVSHVDLVANKPEHLAFVW